MSEKLKAAQPKPSNLQFRLVSGFGMGALFFVSAFYMPPIGWWALLVALCLLGQREFYLIANQDGLPVFRFVGMAAGVALISATFFTLGPSAAEQARTLQWEQLVLLTSVLFVFVRQFPQKNNDKPLETIAATLLGIWYVPFLLNFVTRLTFSWSGWQADGGVSETGRSLVLFAIVVIKLSDVGAFFTGRKLGKHKLFPRLSPKKTWEGLAGGIVFSVVTSLGFFWGKHGQFGELTFRLHDALILGVLLPVVGVVGDIFESLLKRAAGAKDSSHTIPGMGGVLDVLDSLLFGIPVLYVYVTFAMK